MNKIVFSFFLLASLCVQAQDNDCMNRILAASGGWKKNPVTNKTSAADYVIQKRFTDAVNTMMSGYKPRGLQAQVVGSHLPVVYRRPVASYMWAIMAMKYHCNGTELALNHETNTTFRVSFNTDFARLVFEPNTDYTATHFNTLREGFPEEIHPGVWKFIDVRTPLGFGIEGLTKLWLITYPGQLPWVYVTRLEFLQTRRKNLLRMAKEEEERLLQNLADLERQKKEIAEILKNDPAKYAAYIKNDYEPAPQRFRDRHDKTVEGLHKAIERVNEQLEAPEVELKQRAVVIKSTTNHLDYDFADWQTPGAEILTKPNPAYFKKGLAPSVPQLIEVAVQYHQIDSVSAIFARDMETLVNVGYLQSFIGKTTPPAYGGKGIVPMNTVSTTPVQVSPGVAATPSANKAAKPVQSPKPSGASFAVSGTLSAPVNVAVTLSCNNNNDLTITSPKAPGFLYSTSAIRFTKPIKANESFTITLKKTASNMKGVVYKGTGKAPDDTGRIKVGVDYTYELLTRSSGDKVMSSFYESFAPAVGGYDGEEGRYVVFVSHTKGLEGSDGKFRQIFWRDRNTGITKMISATPTGEGANADCAEPSIAADGRSVVFESKASNLVAGDNNGKRDIFLWRAGASGLEIVSKAVDGGAADAESYDASISGNGKFVVFTSTAGNLDELPKGRSIFNIYLRDVTKGSTEMISVDPRQKTGGDGCKGSISFDGSRISFCSASGVLVPDDHNGLWDIFLWQRGQPALKRVSLTHDGKERNGGSESASRQVSSVISGNGKFVAFATTASNMVPGDNNHFQDVFITDVETGKVTVASFSPDGQPSNGDSPIEQGERIALSYDGAWAAFPTKATNLGAQPSNIVLFNAATGKKTAVSDVKGSYVGRPAISYSGGYVIFGKSNNLDSRFSESGIFAHFTGFGPCRDCR